MSSAIRLRILAEEVFRKRSGDAGRRFAGALRRARIETNPHQIDAVLFALERVPEGGCVLADEVGLGKTIEAGLVIAQLRAEGKERVLVLVPLSLAGQWQAELSELLDIQATLVTRESWNGSSPGGAKSRGRAKGEASSLAGPFAAPGVYVVGREFAAADRVLSAIEAAGPWDLVVVDEAHEQFASIYRRFGNGASSADSLATGDLDRGPARRAAKIRAALGGAPYLLLTATPLSNSLLELWGLLQFVDPDLSILGPLDQFRALYTEGGSGRVLNEERADELAERLQQVIHRTLRRQAQPFLEHPFPARHALTAEFRMTPAERRLYDAVSQYLFDGGASWLAEGARRLVLLGLRRRMGSSTAALVASLASLKERVGEALAGGEPAHSLPGAWLADLEGLEEEWDPDEGSSRAASPELLRAELARIEDLLAQARRIKKDSKGETFVTLVARLAGEEKLVVFTESLATQAELARLLESNGFAGAFTLFNGTNRSERADEALSVWQEEVGAFLPAAERPPRTVALRRALIHEFQTRTRVLIATEAGAKGLNLQFCHQVVNYDLPWNPQRIEQRIGRCHRYRQEREVLVVNFVNLDNEAERRVHELLSEKLRLFEWTFGTSDELLGLLVASVDLESEISRILERSRDASSIQEGFRELRSRLDDLERRQVEETLRRTRRLLGRLDASVRSRLSGVADGLTRGLAEHDRKIADLVEAWAAHRGGSVLARREGENLVLSLDVDGALPVAVNGCRTFHVGPPDPCPAKGEPLSPEHPLLVAIRADATAACVPDRIEEVLLDSGKASELLGGPLARPGTAGFWTLFRATFEGLETHESVVSVAFVRSGSGWEALPGIAASRLAELIPRPDSSPQHPEPPPEAAVRERLAEALEEVKKEIRREQEGRVRRILARQEAEERDARSYLDSRIESLRAEIDGEARREIDATTAGELEEATLRRRKLEREIEDMETRSRAERSARRESWSARRRDLLRRRLVEDVRVELLFQASFRTS
ncbi:MAG: hypothetical protein HY720_06440 [Planctomycetes bacterium]|nr:hypothetical protein [Planctomycetota bacterium]